MIKIPFKTVSLLRDLLSHTRNEDILVHTLSKIFWHVHLSDMCILEIVQGTPINKGIEINGKSLKRWCYHVVFNNLIMVASI